MAGYGDRTGVKRSIIGSAQRSDTRKSNREKLRANRDTGRKNERQRGGGSKLTRQRNVIPRSAPLTYSAPLIQSGWTVRSQVTRTSVLLVLRPMLGTVGLPVAVAFKYRVAAAPASFRPHYFIIFLPTFTLVDHPLDRCDGRYVRFNLGLRRVVHNATD